MDVGRKPNTVESCAPQSTSAVPESSNFASQNPTETNSHCGSPAKQVHRTVAASSIEPEEPVVKDTAHVCSKGECKHDSVLVPMSTGSFEYFQKPDRATAAKDVQYEAIGESQIEPIIVRHMAYKDDKSLQSTSLQSVGSTDVAHNVRALRQNLEALPPHRVSRQKPGAKNSWAAQVC